MKLSFSGYLTLYKKFVIIMSLSIIIFMVAIGVFITRRESRIMYTNIENQGRLLAKTLAIPVINDLIYERLGLVEEGGLIDNYISEMYSRKDINLLYIAVLDEQGSVLSHNDFREFGKIYNDPLTIKSLQVDSTIVQAFKDQKTDHGALDFATPLSIGKKRWGTLKFAISLQELEHEIRFIILKIAGLTVLALIGGVFLTIVLGRRFIGPVTNLAKTMEKAGGDKLDVKVDIKGTDELAQLGHNFNQMIDRINDANIKLKQTHEKLLQSEKLASVGILASGVAHEINNPLGGLFNAVDMLTAQGENKEFRMRYLDLLKEGLSRIETTVRRLLWMSRKEERKPVTIKIGQAVDDVDSFIEYRLKKNHITYRKDIEDDASVIIDAHDLRQIIINLMINAVQSMEGHEGTLTVRSHRNDLKTVIEISDTGEGIDDADIRRIFDPFYTTKGPRRGTGLGLWLTYEIVKNYNGEITVKSEKGKGSTFSIEFPHSE